MKFNDNQEYNHFLEIGEYIPVANYSKGFTKLL